MACPWSDPKGRATAERSSQRAGWEIPGPREPLAWKRAAIARNGEHHRSLYPLVAGNPSVLGGRFHHAGLCAASRSHKAPSRAEGSLGVAFPRWACAHKKRPQTKEANPLGAGLLACFVTGPWWAGQGLLSLEGVSQVGGGFDFGRTAHALGGTAGVHEGLQFQFQLVAAEVTGFGVPKQFSGAFAFEGDLDG